VSARPRVRAVSDWAWGGVSGFELSAGPSEQFGCSCFIICRDSLLDKEIRAVQHTYLSGKNTAQAKLPCQSARIEDVDELCLCLEDVEGGRVFAEAAQFPVVFVKRRTPYCTSANIPGHLIYLLCLNRRHSLTLSLTTTNTLFPKTDGSRHQRRNDAWVQPTLGTKLGSTRSSGITIGLWE